MSRFSCLRPVLASLAILLAAPVAMAGDPHVHAVKVGALDVIHPWSRATPGGARVASGYLEVTNRGDKADRLISATAEVAGKVEIHETTMTDGVMGMRHLLNGIELTPGATTTLKPGSYHLMFMDLKRPLDEGNTFAGTLTFRDAGTVRVTFSVEGTGATSPAMPSGHPGGHEHIGH